MMPSPTPVPALLPNPPSAVYPVGPAAALELARDGSLFGYLEDDMELFSGATLLLEESQGCIGDLNGDGRVDLSDPALMLSAVGTLCPKPATRRAVDDPRPAVKRAPSQGETWFGG